MGIPVVEHNSINLALNTSISAADLFSTTDPDGDAIDFYLVQDYQPRVDGGFFRLAGVAQTNGSQFRVEASELADLTYQAASIPRTEGYRVIAVDVNGEFSTAASFGRINSVRTSNSIRPVVQNISTSVLANEVVPVSDFLSAYDPDGFPITQWFIRDRNVDSSFLTFNGVAMPQGEYFLVRANELDQVAYHAFNGEKLGVPATEKFDKFAYDGAQWSEFSTSEITTLPNVNHSVAQSTRTSVLTDARISLAPFSNIADDDGNSIKYYEFRNTSPHAVHGDLILDGVVQPRQEWIRVSPEQLSGDRLVFEGGERNFVQQIRYRGNDGHFTGISGVISIDNDNPTEIFTTLSSDGLLYDEQLQDYSIDSLFPATGDASVVSYQFYDAAAGNGGFGDGADGRFELNGTILPAATIHEFTAEQVANEELVFLTGNDLGRSRDDIYARALNDRGNWSEWERLTVRTEPNYFRAFEEAGSTWHQKGVPIDSLGRLEFSYSFMQDFPDYATGEATDGEIPNHFSPFTPEARDSVRRIFDDLEGITNIKFNEISDQETNVFGQRGGIYRFGNYGAEAGGAAAFAYFPSTAAFGGDSWYDRYDLGEVVVDEETGEYIFHTDPTLAPNTFGFFALMHELMHNFGFNHVFDDSGGTAILPPETNNANYTVLVNGDGLRSDAAATTLQLYDVEVIHRNYGVNTDFNSGDNLYDLETYWSESSLFSETLWDAGGNDTLSLAGSNPAAGDGAGNAIDLSPGGFSTFNGLQDNVAIAFRAEIENAIGSNLADRISGNHLDNIIDGGSGNDILAGQAGEDILTGGAGNDRFIFGVGDGNDVIDEQRLAGRDTIELTQFGSLDNLTEDLRFRLEGRDLIISLHLDDQNTVDGTLRISNHTWGSYRVETLELNGDRFDLVDLARQATSVDQKFALTGAPDSAFGQLVAPV